MLRRAPTRESQWTPYGHEEARRKALMQRHAWLAAGALAVALIYGVFLSVTFTVETDLDVGGTIEVRREEQRPVTVTVSPGREPGFMDGSVQEPEGIAAPGRAPHEDGPIMSTLRPILPVVAPLLGALWLLSRLGANARGKLAELNFGVYKGAMPYEMHTAKRHKTVFTHRLVTGHVFGKRREDFLAGSYPVLPPLSVRRMLGQVDYEDADVTRLRHGGHTRRTAGATRGAAPAPRPTRPAATTGRGRLRRAWDEEGFGGLKRSLHRELRRRQEERRKLQRARRLAAAHHRAAAPEPDPEAA